MNVRTFRNTLKDCLDRAIAGDTIIVERGGVVFELKVCGSREPNDRLDSNLRRAAASTGGILQVNPKSHNYMEAPAEPHKTFPRNKKKL